MSDDRPADDGDEYWQRVHDDVETGFEPAGVDPGVKTDPDDVREWAEERDAVPVTDPEVEGPEAYALRRENVVDGSAHQRMSWDDFAAAFRGETDDDGMEFHHHDDDEAGTHRFVSRAEGGRGEAGDRGVTATAGDEGGDDAQVDIGGVETEAGSDRDDAGTTTGDEGTVVGDRDGGVESGAEADADTATASDADWSLGDVSEGDTVIDSQGETAGIVTAVEADAIYVDPDPGITEKLSAKLGWVDEDDAEYTVDADDVASVEDGDVHLEPVAL